MKVARTLMVCILMTAIMAAVSAWAMSALPDAPIPSHWGLDGRPDRYASPALVLFMLPALALVLSLAFAALPSIMPPRGDLRRSRTSYIAAWVSAVALMLVVHLAIVLRSLGVDVDLIRVVAIATGALLLVIGNYLPKTRFNYVIGVRTPWTLADERVWDRTHRLAGVLMTLAGLSALAGGVLVAEPVMLLALILVPTIGAALVSVIYSAVISPRVGRSG